MLNSNQSFSNYAGGLNQANAIQGGVIGTAPRTISSAIGRVESLNDRLREVVSKLSSLSDQIGGPRPIGGCPKSDSPPVSGAVSHLNDGVDRAHDQISDIDELLSSIARALG